MRKGLRTNQKPEAEALRYRWCVAEIIWYYEGVYRQHQRGLISDSQWETVVTIMLGMLESDVLRAWWEARTPALSEDFFDYIDQRRMDGSKKRWQQRPVSVTGDASRDA